MKYINFITTIILITFCSHITLAQGARSGRNDRMRKMEETHKMSEETTITPCMRYDDDEYFAGSGFMRLKKGGYGERDFTIEINKLLNSIRQQVKQKVGGRYRAVVSDYFDQIDYNGYSSEKSHIESAGEQAIDIYLNDTEEDCREEGPVDEAGYYNLYISILVKKSGIQDAVMEGIKDDKSIPEEARQKVINNEEAFRERMAKVFGSQN